MPKRSLTMVENLARRRLLKKAAMAAGGFALGHTVPSPALAAKTASALGTLGFMHIRQSTFLVALSQTRLLIDPWFTSPPAPGVVVSSPPPALSAGRVGKLDVIVVTQRAPDRVDAESIRGLPSRAASCFVPDSQTAGLFRRAGFRRVREVRAGDRFSIRGGAITFGRSPDGLFDRPQVACHVEGGGRTFLHTGAPPPLMIDNAIAKFAADHPAELVLGCASGVDVGDRAAFMSEEDAFVVASLAKARYLIPHSVDVTPGFVGALFLTTRREEKLPAMTGGPKLHRARKGRWTVIARPKSGTHKSGIAPG